MEPILFLLSMVGIVIIIWWSVTNDLYAEPSETDGLLAMHSGEKESPKRTRKRKFADLPAALSNRFRAVPDSQDVAK